MIVEEAAYEAPFPSRPLESQLVECIQASLSNHLATNASFLAERLLAECYLAENKVYKLVTLLKDSTSDMNRYRLAVALLKVNKE